MRLTCIFLFLISFTFLTCTQQVYAASVSVDSITATTIVVNSNSTPSWKATFRSDLGGVLSSLVIPSSSSTNIIDTSSTSNRLYGMGLVTRDTNSMFCESNASIHLLESTQTRIVISVSGDLYDFTDGACGSSNDGEYTQIYTIYPDRIVVHGAFSSSTAGTGMTGPYISFAPSLFDENAFISDHDTAPGTVTPSAAIQSVADITYTAPGISLTLTGSDPATGTDNDYMIHALEVPSFFPNNEFLYQNDENVITAGLITDDSLSGGQSYTYTYVFQITDDNSLSGNEAKSYAVDLWQPDSLFGKISVGSAWSSASEFTNTGESDYFNQTQNSYPLITSNNIISFNLDGETYSRYAPIFKFRNWRTSNVPTNFSIEGTNRTINTDYNANLIPFSQAWFYDSSNTWKQLARGGLASDTNEYLADSQDNASFDQGSYQIFDNSNDYLYLGNHTQFSGVNTQLQTKGAGSGIITVWSYCGSNLDINTPCDTWSTLAISNSNSGASTFTSAGNVYYTVPNEWTKSTVNGGHPLYYIRINKTAGDYTTYPIEQTIYSDLLLLQSFSAVQSDGQTFDIYHRATPSLSFAIEGVPTGTSNNGITTNINTTHTTLPFGNLSVGVPKFGSHKLTVNSNTDYGYDVSVKLYNQMQGNYPDNNIDEFAATSVTWQTPQIWSAPNGIVRNVNTGWVGVNTSDTRVEGWSNASAKFGPLSTISHSVMSSQEAEEKTVYVSYAIEVNYLQPSDLYEGTIVYNILPEY